jgi:hypothetical protein
MSKELWIQEEAAELGLFLRNDLGVIHAGPTCGKSHFVKAVQRLAPQIKIVDTDDLIKEHLDWNSFPRLRCCEADGVMMEPYYALGLLAAKERRNGAIVVTNVYHTSFVNGLLDRDIHERRKVGSPFGLSLMRRSPRDVNELSKQRGGREWDPMHVVEINENWSNHFAGTSQHRGLLNPESFLSDVIEAMYWGFDLPAFVGGPNPMLSAYVVDHKAVGHDAYAYSYPPCR